MAHPTTTPTTSTSTAVHGNCMWYHDWNIIQEAVERNRNRIHLVTMTGKKKKQIGEEVIQVIPTSNLNDDDNEDENGNGNGNSNDNPSNINNNNGGSNSDDEICMRGSDDVINDDVVKRLAPLNPTWMNVNKTSRIAKRRRRERNNINSRVRFRLRQQQEEEDESGREAMDDTTIARQPSALGNARWTMQDIKNDLGEVAMKDLERTMLHDNEEVESTKKYSLCQGALKTLGNIHLWEQVRANLWKGHMDEIPMGGGYGEVGQEQEQEEEEHDSDVESQLRKKRKRSYQKARKFRLVPFVEKRTGADISKGTKVVRAAENERYASRRSPEKSLELDLGECTVEVIVSSHLPTNATNDMTQETKVNLAFRSLELSLIEE